MLFIAMQYSASLQLIAGLDQLAAIRDFVQREAAQLGVDQSAIEDLLLAVTEVVTNGIEHGYNGQPGPFKIEIGANSTSVLVSVTDQAPPFDPRLGPLPDLSVPSQIRPPGGLGLFLIHTVTDELLYRPLPEGGNKTGLVKRHTQAAAT
jgi:anti-sigma regulatory factor (Ser/Thr protein kinase)